MCASLNRSGIRLQRDSCARAVIGLSRALVGHRIATRCFDARCTGHIHRIQHGHRAYWRRQRQRLCSEPLSLDSGLQRLLRTVRQRSGRVLLGEKINRELRALTFRISLTKASLSVLEACGETFAVRFLF